MSPVIDADIAIYLAVIFLFVAMLYSSVGLGGGSTYTAVMAIAGVNFVLIPGISLALNLVVTMIGMINFGRQGHIKPKIIFPFLLTSMPMAYFGGMLSLSRELFFWLLLITLIFVALRIYVVGKLEIEINLKSGQRLALSMFLGAVLGFVAGTVGIGGGIYLVPLLILFSLATEKEAAAAGAVFIWLNSLVGFIARVQRGAFDESGMIPLILAVILGGYVGSYFGSFKFQPGIIQKTLGVAIIIAIFFITGKLI